MKYLIHLKSYFTFLSRNKAYTVINVFGLSLSLMFVLLMMIYVKQEYSVDSNLATLDRLYLIENRMGVAGQEERFTGNSVQMGNYLKKNFPEIELTTGFAHERDYTIKSKNGTSEYVDILFADSTLYQVFDYQLTLGNKETVLKSPENAVISEQFARRRFGNANPMGQRISINDTLSVVVAGTFATMGNTIVPSADIICTIPMSEKLGISDPDYTNSLGGSEIIIQTKEGSGDFTQKSKLMEQVIFKAAPFLKDFGMHFRIVPMKSVYLSQSKGRSRRGNIGMVQLFGFVALVILLFAIINYVNLTVAQANNRAREMATHRLFGCSRSDIVLRLITESFILCFVSLLVAVVLGIFCVPYIEELINTKLVLSEALTLSNAAYVLLALLTISLLSGIIPAILLSRTQPIEVVRGTFRHITKMRMSKVFIVIQSICTIVLIASSLIIHHQIKHLLNAPLGYNTEHIMQLESPLGFADADVTPLIRFRDELKKLSCVEMVSLCTCAPMQGGSNQSPRVKGKTVGYQFFRGDDNFIKILGLKVEKDYQLNNDLKLYITRNVFSAFNTPETAREIAIYGDESPEMKEKIGGIVKPFKASANDDFLESGPIVIYIQPKEVKNYLCRSILIKVKGDEQAAQEAVTALYKKIFRENLLQKDIYFKDIIRSGYTEQIRLFQIITLFAVIAVLISFLGLIAMSTYFIQQRNKEIALRKVFGSTGSQVRWKLIRTFLNYILLAFLLSIPLTWYFMNRWISTYSYRTTWWGIWIPVAGIIVLVISYAAVAIQSYIASDENPVKHLKQE